MEEESERVWLGNVGTNGTSGIHKNGSPLADREDPGGSLPERP